VARASHATEGWALQFGTVYKGAMPNHLARANRQRMTDAEMRLWFRLRPMRSQGMAFRRQSPIGNYVIDFERRRAKLCIEVDGAQHSMNSAQAYDAARTEWLKSQGYEVLRFSNYDVLRQTDVIVDQIIETAKRKIAERNS
jgi:very-short-patch-repair endonuclease